jgi:hypothetical protein
VTTGDKSLELDPGDVACYRADRLHAIEAKGGAARAILMVRNS